MKPIIFPRNLNNPDLNPGFISFQYYTKELGNLLPKENICLSMPEEISQPSTVSWDNEKFGMAGETLVQGLKQMSSAGDNTQSISELMSATKARMIGGAQTNIAKNLVGVLGSGASSEGIMGEVSGKIPNPYVTAIFRGVNFRNFDFVFRFTPLSIEDCDRIDQIIKIMRKNALPGLKGNNTFLTYPHECEITYCWKGKQNKWLNRFKRAACTKIDINYTGTGAFTAHRNGFPSQIVLTTSWSELEIVTREDVGDGF